MDKYDVIARCEAIITRQIAHTSNPQVRSYLNEVADRIAEYGMGESYKIIEYSNCITLINDDYQDEVNFKLFENNRLEIGCFDSGLKFNDRQFILIEPDQEICYIAWNDHGTLRGDAEMARLEYDSHGKQVRYHIKGTSSSSDSRDGRVVKNTNRGFFGRLFRNETIGRLDYTLSLFAMLFIFGLAGNLIPFFGGKIGTLFAIVLVVAVLFAWYQLNKKRYLDLDHTEGSARFLAIIALFIAPIILYLILAPTKVRTEQEAAKEAAKEASRESNVSENARNALRRRCDTIDAAPAWLRITPSEKEEAMRLRPGRNQRGNTSSSMSQSRQSNNEMAGESQLRRELEGAIAGVESKETEIKGQLKSIEPLYKDEQADADYYQRLADSASDEQERDKYQSEADRHQSQADEYKGLIDSMNECLDELDACKRDLNHDLSNLHANL